MRTKLLLCAVALAQSCLYVDAQSLPHESLCRIQPAVHAYQVRGNNYKELVAAMLAAGPVDAKGKRRFAYAEWHVDWKWDTRSDGSVDLSTLTVTCQGDLTLPSLVITEGKSHESMRATWEGFLRRIKSHELRHLSHAEHRAPLIRERLRARERAVGPLRPEEANKVAKQVIEEIRELDRAYDRETEHGKSEGCWEIEWSPGSATH